MFKAFLVAAILVIPALPPAPSGGGGSLTLTERDDWGGNSPQTSASFTPSDNSLLVVCATGWASATATISDSLSSTWTEQDGFDTGGGFASFAKVWTTPITTGSSMTVTITASSGIAFSAAVDITGYDTGDPVGLSADDGSTSAARSGSYSLSLGGTTASDSIVLGCIQSQSSLAADITPGTGWTEIVETEDGGGGAFSVQYIEGAESSFDYDDFDVDNSPFAGWAAVAVEVQAN